MCGQNVADKYASAVTKDLGLEYLSAVYAQTYLQQCSFSTMFTFQLDNTTIAVMGHVDTF